MTQQVAAVARDARELLRQAQVEVALVVEAGQAVALGDLVRAPRVEQVLDRDRRVVGEDLEQPAVLLAEAAGPRAVDELEHAAHRRLDADRHAEHRLRLEAVGQVVASGRRTDRRRRRRSCRRRRSRRRGPTMPMRAFIRLPSRASPSAPKVAMKTSSFSSRSSVFLVIGSSRRIEPASEGTNSLAFWRISRRKRSISISPE